MIHKVEIPAKLIFNGDRPAIDSSRNGTQCQDVAGVGGRWPDGTNPCHNGVAMSVAKVSRRISRNFSVFLFFLGQAAWLAILSTLSKLN
jgi:hypothetical protein